MQLHILRAREVYKIVGLESILIFEISVLEKIIFIGIIFICIPLKENKVCAIISNTSISQYINFSKQ